MRAFQLQRQELRESDIVKACLDLLHWRHWKTVRIFCGPFYTYSKKQILNGAPVGTPDYVCVHALHTGFFLEVKRPGGKLSPWQKERIAEIEQTYQVPCIKVDSARALKEFLDQHERKL